MASFTPQEIEQFLQQFFDVVGTRQYIGARYVPIFGRKGEGTIEWNDLLPYEPLTIVLHRGNSYTSRQYVPAGIQIDETDYWVCTGDYNAQVEEYRKELYRVVSEIENMTDDFIQVPPDGYGSSGQVLTTNGVDGVYWNDAVEPSQESVNLAVSNWLDLHPEATTTVEDGSITNEKIADATIRDEKLVPYGVLYTSDYALGIVRSICDSSQGTIDMRAHVNVNDVYGSPRAINWENGKIVSQSQYNTGIIAIPCQANSAYTITANPARNRLAMGCCSQLPPIDDELSVYAGGANYSSLSITTDSTAKWLVIFFYTTYVDTDTIEQAFASLTLTGPTYTANDTVARNEINDLSEIREKVSFTTGTYDGKISLDNAINLNSVYETTGMSVNWITGKIINNEDIDTGIIAFPCKPNSTYRFDSSVQLYRFVAGYCDAFPTIGTNLSGTSGYPNPSTLEFTTGSESKYIVLWYWDERGTLTERESYAAVSASGPYYTAIDYVARSMIIGTDDAVGILDIEINDNQWWIDTNGVIKSSATSRTAYVNVTGMNKIGVTATTAKRRFKIGFSTLEPSVNTELTGVRDLSSSSGDYLNIPLGAAYLCVFYYTQSDSEESATEALNSLRFFGAKKTGIDLYARNRLTSTAAQVVVDKSGEFSTIGMGCAAVADGGTVIVMPGTYEEQIDVRSKTVHIIGVDKYSCILLDNSGMYNTPPIEISNGSIKNMTIIETSRDSTPESAGTNPTLAYCIHCDFDYEMNGQLDIDDCILIANKRCVIGSGVRSGWKLNVRNCYMWSGIQAKREAIRGCFFVHTGLPLTADPIVPSEVKLVNNEINCDDELAVCFRDLTDDTFTVPFVVTAINNMIYSSVTGKTDKVIWGTEPNNVIDADDVSDFQWTSGVSLDPRSYGNNVSIMNAV